jgi:L-ascorbate metabolism protein UlaG (beta-lactamase superfamily)
VNVEYISHACLLIDTGDVRIATDPWFAGPAYSRQWYVFPKPVNAAAVETAGVIAISHGHEDHFHPQTLRGLANKNARVFYPDSWFGGAKEFIASLGFANVTEAVSWRKYRLTKDTSITYVANGHDNIMVIKSGGEILVNINDALHSEADATIDFFIDEIKRGWPRIDVLFCGFGGASYFPNMLHVDGKDDHAVAAVREQLLARNFCRVVAGLKPRVAIPFAADFALLAPAERWINEVRFPRSLIKDYFEREFAEAADETQVQIMYPGDVLHSQELEPASPYRARLRNGELTHLIDEQYADEIARKANPDLLSAEAAHELSEDLREQISLRAAALGVAQFDQLKFCINVSDVGEGRAFNIRFEKGEARVERAPEPHEDCAIVITTPSRILRYAMKHEFGGDAIGIGYGADFQLRDRDQVTRNLDQVCYQLLTRMPTRKAYLRENPRRVAGFLARQPPLRTWRSYRKSGTKVGAANYDRSIWLLRDAEELRRIFSLPEIASEPGAVVTGSCSRVEDHASISLHSKAP